MLPRDRQVSSHLATRCSGSRRPDRGAFRCTESRQQSHDARPQQGGQIVRTTREPAGSWTAAAPLPVPEVSQAALLLANGDVLMTGGEDVKDGRPTSVVQRYHTAAGTWSTVAAMRQERIGHTVTLLKDGRVLAVGGLGKKLQPLSSVEIYDPVRDRWASTVPLPDVRFSHSATLLPDGRVLVVGGIVHGAISRSVLIFDPRKPAWRAGPPTLSPHAQQDALALPDGRVLIAGGYGGRAEVYDPRAGKWTEVGGPDVLAHPILASAAQWACPARHGCRQRGTDLQLRQPLRSEDGPLELGRSDGHRAGLPQRCGTARRPRPGCRRSGQPAGAAIGRDLRRAEQPMGSRRPDASCTIRGVGPLAAERTCARLWRLLVRHRPE